MSRTRLIKSNKLTGVKLSGIKKCFASSSLASHVVNFQRRATLMHCMEKASSAVWSLILCPSSQTNLASALIYGAHPQCLAMPVYAHSMFQNHLFFSIAPQRRLQSLFERCAEMPFRSCSVYTGDGPGGIYGPDDASQAVEAGWTADVKQDGFFPASSKVHKLQTTNTHIQ